jgi:hypothetical protein
MRTYLSKIEARNGNPYGGGQLYKIIILDSLAEGIAAGDKHCEAKFGGNSYYDSHYEEVWHGAKSRIMHGEPGQRDEIAKLAARLCDMVLDAEPSLSCGVSGIERCEDGFAILPELALAGDERCEIRRRKSQEIVKPGAGDGAYRIIINTDVPWWADPTTNAAVMGALVMVCQNFGPVEIWIQQGWIGGDPNDGITLFRLDYSGQFEPAHVAFWAGDKCKDRPFSEFINKGLGRIGTSTSVAPQIPCDLYMHGCWIDNAGLYGVASDNERIAMAAKWVAQKAKEIVFQPETTFDE